MFEVVVEEGGVFVDVSIMDMCRVTLVEDVQVLLMGSSGVEVSVVVLVMLW